MEVWWLDVGIATPRHGGMEVWGLDIGVVTGRYEGLEARCKCSDVEAWTSRAIQACCRRATLRDGGMERWICATGM